MTAACLDYVRSVLERYPQIRGNTLEVGSYDVNGSVRPLFADRGRFPTYWGIDLREGPGVDQVINIHEVGVGVTTTTGLNRLFGVIVSTEMLEHDTAPWKTMAAMARRLTNPGHVIITTRGIHFPRHDYPSDYWRFTADGLGKLFEQAGLRTLEVVEDETDQGTYGLAAL